MRRFINKRLAVSCIVVTLAQLSLENGAALAQTVTAQSGDVKSATHYRRGNLCRGSLAQCNGFSCAGSPSIISDIVPPSQPGADALEILDINVVYDGERQAGWLYRLSDGRIVIQFSYSGAVASQAFEAAFATHGYDRRAVAAANRYSGLFPWNASLPFGVTARKCVTGGAVLAHHAQPR